ncbi:MAG: type II toxin-antitoxin system RelE/ParE family toxin [Xanthobacteraceae bacterium]
MTRVVISPLAKRDLTAIGDYIARDNPRAAREFIRKMRSRCFLLRTAPWMGRTRDDFGEDIRSLTYGSYLIFYRYREDLDHVDILRFWHGRRLPPDVSELLD